LSTSDPTFDEWVDEIFYRMMPAQRPIFTILGSAYTAGSTTIQLGGAGLGAVLPGALLNVDYEDMLVEACSSTGLATVVPGYNGSTEANHSEGAVVYVNPRFSKNDISRAINDDISDLSAPENGLFQAQSINITYTPPFQGYDLTGLPTNFIDILEVRYQIAPPNYNQPRITRWEVLRNQLISRFPSGNGLVIRGDAWPGFPMTLIYSAPFTQIGSGQSASATGLPVTAYDLPVLGAQILLHDSREIKRNATEAQPDSRKAPEVPPQAVANSTVKLEQRRQKRIDAEADRLRRQYAEYSMF
jgi:hypothetical protein